MDVKKYFQKLRELEASIRDAYPLVMSLETEDGGKAGLITEVPRSLAAKMILEGRAVLANEAEQESFRERQIAARKAAEKEELAKRLQVTVLTESDLHQQFTAKKNQGSSVHGK